MKRILIISAAIIFCVNIFAQEQPELNPNTKPMLSLTFDDPSTEDEALMSWQEKNTALLKILEQNGLRAALFISGKKINSTDGAALLQSWNDNGHMICNHSFMHSYFPSKKITLEDYRNDFLRVDSILNKYPRFTRLFRFPFLKEGNSIEKRDGFRKFLDSLGYKMGYATIDASDWYFDSRMRDTLKIDKNFDLAPYKEFYLKHLYDRAVYYDSLAVQLTGRKVKHTLLLHHNVLNALFLDDVIKMFKDKGWDILNADDAFTDEVFTKLPDILPAGESIIWAMAKETGKYEDKLRYPGEDGEYEEEAFNQYLKSYFTK